MQPGNAVLALLRQQPKTTIRAWGFIVRGALLSSQHGSQCSLDCQQHRRSSVYQIDISSGNRDWYIPFGDKEARRCDVPSGQPNGTLVVTFPMNGCALAVHATDTGNRFFHDSDGNSMGGMVLGAEKLRVVYADYAGPHNVTHERSLRYFGPDKENAGGYEHSIICVKEGAEWGVYASAIIRLNGDAWQVKDRVPYEVGRFAD